MSASSVRSLLFEGRAVWVSRALIVAAAIFVVLTAAAIGSRTERSEPAAEDTSETNFRHSASARVDIFIWREAFYLAQV